MGAEEYDTILHSERLRLEERDDRLTALETAGVDNWEGYGHAMQILHGDDDD